MPIVSYHPAADAEVTRGAQFYEQHVAGLGAAFLDEVDAAVTLLCTQPEMFSLRADGTRRCPLKRFPHRLVYRVEQERLRIYALAHPRLRPGHWRSRLEE